MGVLKNMMNWVSGNKPEETATTQPATTKRRPQPRQEPEGPTLDPARIVDTRNLREALPGLAGEFNAEATYSGQTDSVMAEANLIFETAGKAVTEAEESYISGATTTLETVKANITKADERVRTQGGTINVTIAKAAETAKGEVNRFVAERARELSSLRAKLKAAHLKLRELTVGLTGNPTREIPKSDGIVDLLGTIVAFTAMLALELGVNLGLVRHATDYTTSAAFSVGMALVAALTAHMAAMGSKLRSAYYDAKTECERYFSRYDRMIDPETGHVAHVFPPSGIVSRLTILSHIAFIGACVTVLAIRLAIIIGEHRSLGDLAGSVAFVLIVLGYYIFKLHSSSKYPSEELGLYHVTKDDVEQLTDEVNTLESIAGAEEISSITSAYNDTITRAKASLEPFVQAAKATRNQLARLITEAKRAPAWFLELYHDTIADIIMAIAKRSPGAEKNPALVIESERAEVVNRLFSDNRPNSIDFANLAVGPVPTVEIKQVEVDLAQLASDAWLQAIAEREKQETERKKRTLEPVNPRIRVNFVRGRRRS